MGDDGDKKHTNLVLIVTSEEGMKPLANGDFPQGTKFFRYKELREDLLKEDYWDRIFRSMNVCSRRTLFSEDVGPNDTVEEN